MGPKGTVIVSITAIALAACGTADDAFAMAAPPRSPAAGSSWSALPLRQAHPEAIALTLYSQGWGLVRDVGRVTLASGLQVVRFSPVASHLDTRMPPLLDIAGSLEASRFTNDLGDPDRKTALYDGKTVQIFLPRASRPISATQVETATGPLYKVGDELYSVPPERVVLPLLPGMSPAPALDWQVRAPGPWSGLATASYAATGLSWASSYTLRTDAGQTQGNWSQWADLSNQAGVSFPDARITLIAGQVQRAGTFPFAAPEAEMRAAPGAMFSPIAPDSYAARVEYRLPSPVTLAQGSSWRTRIAGPSAIGITRTFRFENSVPLFAQLANPAPLEAQIRLSLVRGATGPLAGPLPAGVVTVYTPDRHGNDAIAGQASLGDTPPGQPLRLDLGQAFGITMRRVQTRFRVTAGGHDLAFDLGLSNRQDLVAPIVVVEHLPGDWKMVSASQPYTRPNATDLKFSPVLPPHTDATISYEVTIQREPQTYGLP